MVAGASALVVFANATKTFGEWTVPEARPGALTQAKALRLIGWDTKGEMTASVFQ